LTTETI